MMGLDLVSMALVALSAIAGVFGVLWKFEKSNSADLKQQNVNLDRETQVAKRQAKLAEDRATLHREAAKTAMKHNGIAEDKANEISKRIEDAQDGTTITVTT